MINNGNNHSKRLQDVNKSHFPKLIYCTNCLLCPCHMFEATESLVNPVI